MEWSLSERARRYLDTWERRPCVDDLGLVRAAIEEVGLPVTEPVLDFHRTFAGYMVDVWGEYGPLGIIHPEVVSVQSWFEPKRVGGYVTADPPSLACADIHASYEMMIELDGTFHCNGPEASSYFLWFERSALQHEFFSTRRARVLRTKGSPQWLKDVFITRLSGLRVDALSDAYCETYVGDRFVVCVGQQGQQYHVLVAEGELPAELADFQRPG